MRKEKEPAPHIWFLVANGGPSSISPYVEGVAVAAAYQPVMTHVPLCIPVYLSFRTVSS